MLDLVRQKRLPMQKQKGMLWASGGHKSRLETLLPVSTPWLGQAQAPEAQEEHSKFLGGQVRGAPGGVASSS